MKEKLFQIQRLQREGKSLCVLEQKTWEEIKLGIERKVDEEKPMKRRLK